MAGYNKPISEYGHDESVLIIATPRNCGECWLKVKTEDMPDGMIWCPVINQLTDEQERDDGCMLIPEPERIKKYSVARIIGDAQEKNVEPPFAFGYIEGWDACLDALEGET